MSAQRQNNPDEWLRRVLVVWKDHLAFQTADAQGLVLEAQRPAKTTHAGHGVQYMVLRDCKRTPFGALAAKDRSDSSIKPMLLFPLLLLLCKPFKMFDGTKHDNDSREKKISFFFVKRAASLFRMKEKEEQKSDMYDLSLPLICSASPLTCRMSCSVLLPGCFLLR